MASLPEIEAIDHDYLGPGHDRNGRRTWWVVALTSVMMVAEIVAGRITGSMALLADGVHMATHAGALGIAALAYSYARRHVHNPRFSFGTGKVGDLAGFASALALGLVAIGIGIESVARLMAPVAVDFADATLIAVIGLVVNIVSAALLSGGHMRDHHHDHHQHHHHHHDHNLRAAYAHVLADALTSLLAIGALLAGRWLGWVWLDPAIGLVGAAVIARWAWGLLRETALVLLDSTDMALADEMRRRIEGPGDALITDLHVWRVGPGAHAAIVSMGGDCGLDRTAIRQRLSGLPTLRHVTVECG